jgi:hypothetical protein
MYCIHCGKKLEGGNFCISCGKKVGNGLGGQPQNTASSTRSIPAAPAAQRMDKKPVFIIIGVAAVILIASILLKQGISRPKYTAPYDSNPYSGSQGLYQLPPDYSYDFSDDSYSFDTDDSYNYGSSSQICISCHSSGYCDTCNGTGQYSMYGNPLSECPSCNGTGDCSICGGDGIY